MNNFAGFFEGLFFGNIGAKIKNVCVRLMMIEIVIFVIFAIIMLREYETFSAYFILCPIALWFSNIFGYAVGEIIESLQLANKQRKELLEIMKENKMEIID